MWVSGTGTGRFLKEVRLFAGTITDIRTFRILNCRKLTRLFVNLFSKAELDKTIDL